MKKSVVEATICGIVSENDLEKASYVKNGVETKCIRGELKIRVEQPIYSADEDPVVLEIPVSVFQPEKKKDGTPNKIYLSLMEVIDKIQSIASVGIEKATWVSISNARLEMNEYYKADALVSFPRITASFINIITPNKDTKMVAKFSIAPMYVQSITEEVKDDEPTGRLIVKGIVIKYDESADVMDFVVANDKAIAFIQDKWEPGSTVDTMGVLNFSTTTETKEIEGAGFGDETMYTTRTKKVSELVLRAGWDPKDGDFEFTDAEIMHGGELRKERLAKLKSQADAKANTASSSNTSKGKGVDLSSLGF